MSSSKDGYHHGDLARALEDAAMQLLERMPAAEISLREVARAANVSHNAPYHHFSDRLGLLKAIAERSMADLLDRVRAAAENARTPRAALTEGGSAYIRFASSIRTRSMRSTTRPSACPGLPPRRWRL